LEVPTPLNVEQSHYPPVIETHGQVDRSIEYVENRRRWTSLLTLISSIPVFGLFIWSMVQINLLDDSFCVGFSGAVTPQQSVQGFIGLCMANLCIILVAAVSSIWHETGQAIILATVGFVFESIFGIVI